MKIGLLNCEPEIVNSAMMRVSLYHKKMGDQVEIYNPFIKDYDRIYAFSIFNFSDKGYVTKEMVCGGTGFDIYSKLPQGIEDEDYDWSLYPNCEFSLVWFSTGCFRNCEFCVVPKKEGLTKSINPKNLNPNGRWIKIQDNNFFANPKWREAIKQLQEWGQPVEFAGGLDIRIMTKEMADALNSLKHEKQIKIAWDDAKQDLRNKLQEVTQWIKPYRFMCFVLIGFNSTSEEDLFRIESLRELKIDPFVMPFDKKNQYQKNFARWVNHKAIFKSVKWVDYKKKTLEVK